MTLLHSIRNSQILRWPLLATAKLLLRPLKTGPAILRRAAYDAMPVPYLVTGHPELFVVSTADKVIGRELFLHSEFDFEKLQKAVAILEREGLPRPNHLIDVGANIGTIVIPALKRGLMRTATAIEPHPENLRLLHANLALNELTQCVKVLGIAVGNEVGNSLFLKESATNSGNHMIGKEGIEVQSERLDDLEFPGHSSLLWMDIEGYEGHALAGASRLMATGIPLVFEYNPVLLAHSSGMTYLLQALEGRRLFDLKKHTGDETSTEQLSLRYTGGEDFTDILAVVDVRTS